MRKTVKKQMEVKSRLWKLTCLVKKIGIYLYIQKILSKSFAGNMAVHFLVYLHISREYGTNLVIAMTFFFFNFSPNTK